MDSEASTPNLSDIDEEDLPILVEIVGRITQQPCKWFTFMWELLFKDRFIDGMQKSPVAHRFHNKWYLKTYMQWCKLYQIPYLSKVHVASPEWRCFLGVKIRGGTILYRFGKDHQFAFLENYDLDTIDSG